MGAVSERKKSFPQFRKGKAPRGKTKHVALTEQHLAFCSWFVRTNNKWASSAHAGFHPRYGAELLERQDILAHITKLRDKLEKDVDRKVEKKYALEKEYVDITTVHLLETLQTHEYRGDADRVKLVEVAHKAVGSIQPAHVSATANAGAIAQAASNNMLDVYESKWLTEKKVKMSEYLEQKHAALPAPQGE